MEKTRGIFAILHGGLFGFGEVFRRPVRFSYAVVLNSFRIMNMQTSFVNECIQFRRIINIRYF